MAQAPPTKAEFIKRGDAICARQGRQLRASVNKANERASLGTGQPTRKFQEEVIERAIMPSFRREVEALAALQRPEGDERTVAGFIEAFRAAVARGEKNPALGLRPGQPPFGDVGEELKRYGFRVCGRGL